MRVEAKNYKSPGFPGLKKDKEREFL